MTQAKLDHGPIHRWFTQTLPEYRPRPHTGRLWLDVFYLFVIAALEQSLLRSLTGTYLVFDLLTPWLLLGVVQRRPGSAITITALAALVREAQSSIPAGTYLCAYWIITSIIVQVRPALSWRNISSWFAMFAVSSLFLIVFSVFVELLLGGEAHLDVVFSLSAFLQVVVSVSFGLMLCRPWLAFDAEEPVPQ